MNAIIMYGESRVFEFLSKPKISTQLDEDTVRALQSGALRLDDATLYNRKNIIGLSGTQDLFEPSDSEEQGIRNFSKGELPKYNHFIVAGVKMEVCGSNSTSDPAHVANYVSTRSSFPAALANGKLIIEQNDKPLLELEVFEATSTAAVASAVGNDDVFLLKQLRLIRAGVGFKWKIKFANGETVISANTYVHLGVSLIGWKTRLD